MFFPFQEHIKLFQGKHDLFFLLLLSVPSLSYKPQGLMKISQLKGNLKEK